MTDTIADMLTRIRNAQMAQKADVLIPYSKINFKIAEILLNEGYVEKVEKVQINKFEEILVNLKYNQDKMPAIRKIKKVSKSGRRVYNGKNNLPKVLNGLGILIVSTSKGVMTNKQARKQGVGGEVLCEVY